MWSCRFIPLGQTESLLSGVHTSLPAGNDKSKQATYKISPNQQQYGKALHLKKSFIFIFSVEILSGGLILPQICELIEYNFEFQMQFVLFLLYIHAH